MDEKFLLQVLNSSESSILTLDPNFNVTFFNDSSKKILSQYGLDENYFIKTKNPFSFSQEFLKNNKEMFFAGSPVVINKLSLNDYILDVEGHIIGIKNDMATHHDDEQSILGLTLTIHKIKKIISEDSAKRRTFGMIRNLVLNTLTSKRKTINQIAKDVGVNWRTVESHLTYLCGKKLAKEVFSSEYVRIFDITEDGRLKLGIEKYKENLNSKNNHINNEDSIAKYTNLDNKELDDKELDNNDNDSLSLNDYEMSQEVQK